MGGLTKDSEYQKVFSVISANPIYMYIGWRGNLLGINAVPFNPLAILMGERWSVFYYAVFDIMDSPLRKRDIQSSTNFVSIFFQPAVRCWETVYLAVLKNKTEYKKQEILITKIFTQDVTGAETILYKNTLETKIKTETKIKKKN